MVSNLWINTVKLFNDPDPSNHIADDPVIELILHKTSIST
jgi:hypothetical protein